MTPVVDNSGHFVRTQYGRRNGFCTDNVLWYVFFGHYVRPVNVLWTSLRYGFTRERTYEHR